METDIVICLLIGLPGVGKTTLSKCLFNRIELQSYQIIILTFDDLVSIDEQETFVQKVRMNPNENSFKELRFQYYQLVSDTIQHIRNHDYSSLSRFLIEPRNSSRFILILDDNFYYRSMRNKFYQLACKYGCGFCQLYLKCDANIARQRNSNRTFVVKEEVIEVMAQRLEPPLESNTWEAKSFLVLDSEKENHEDVDRILALLFRCFDNALESAADKSRETEAAREQCMKNVQHRADLILRKFVSDKIKAHKTKIDSKQKLKLYSRAINDIRQKLLLQIKENDVDLSAAIDNNQIDIVRLETSLLSIFNQEFLKFSGNFNSQVKIKAT